MPTPAANEPRRARPQTRARRRPVFSLLEDISTIVTQSQDLRGMLERIVEVVAERMDTEVCSLYLYEPRDRRLTLWATTGLDRSSIGRVSMSVSEGLVGYVIERMQPVMAIDAMAHPRYKYFPETGEERYHSFLAVPVVERQQPAGVLVVQTSRRRRFSLAEVRLLRTIAAHVSSIIGQARLLETLESKEEERRALQRRMSAALRDLEAYEKREGKPKPVPAGHARLTGIAASPGFAIGRAHLLEAPLTSGGLPQRRTRSAREEIQRYRAALRKSIEEIVHFRNRVRATLPEMDASILDSHRLMLEDETLSARVEALIREGLSAEASLERVVKEYVERFRSMGDAYLRERGLDIQDIGQRVLRNLLGVRERGRNFSATVILVANELALSDLVLIEQAELKGIVLAGGGVTSHASILARSLEIPTVIGVDPSEIREGDRLIVDGNAGIVYVNPPLDIVREYERLEREYRAFNRELSALRDLPAVTRDGKRIKLEANIVLFSDLNYARQHGAEGIGLYRTEFPFLSHRDFLGEEEQVELYSRIVAGMEGKPVTIRTLDLGADKYPAYLRVPREENPFLGWRSIRISLEMADVFKTQLRAILRASAVGPVRMLFPMISSVEEVLRVKELVQEAREELDQAGHPYDRGLPIGVMVEVPSAVDLAHHLIREVDFFSIGTNDLIQYLLAVDRNNRKVAPLYEPLHPAVLRAIAHTTRVAREAGKEISICGEMAADPVCTLALIGVGLEALSMGPFFIPVIKRLIRSVDFASAERLARRLLELPTVKEVKSCLFEGMRELGVIDVTELYH